MEQIISISESEMQLIELRARQKIRQKACRTIAELDKNIKYSKNVTISKI